MSVTTQPRGIAARTYPEIQLRIAAERAEREEVFRLIYQSYRSARLCEPNPAKLRFTPYQLLPTTDILFAELKEEVICTLSLVHDGELGLPMEDLYAEQVRERRAKGLKLAEVSCLADRRNEPARFFDLFCDLARLMVQLAEKQSVDQLLIVVHPRHAALYARYMGFQRIGDRKDYSAVNGNPAVPLALDLNAIRTNQPPCWDRFFGEKISVDLLQSQPISRSDRHHFLEMFKDLECSVEQNDLEQSDVEFDQEAELHSNSKSRKSNALLCA